MSHKHLVAIVTVALLPLVSCAIGGRNNTNNNNNNNNNGMCPSNCNTSCNSSGTCMDCLPGQNGCDSGGNVASCNSDGTIGSMVSTCNAAAGQACMGGVCVSACDAAAGSHSYLGCDYWPTTTVNSSLNNAFHFAVAVANPVGNGDVTMGMPATVTVSRGGQTISSITVAPGDVQVIKLPWVQALSQNPDPQSPPDEKSVLVPNGAYHLTSTVPVTVYEFNPLEFELPSTATCQDQLGGPTCHSYTNDASLLLPTPALNTEYIVAARQTFAVDFGNGLTPLPGFMAIVGTQAGTKVTVTYSANTEPGTGVPGQGPGTTATYTLNAGDVLEVMSKKSTSPCAQMTSDSMASYCDLGPNFDLTGTHILSDKPVAVFGGHSCSFVPYDKWACDHLETQILPLGTWGQNIVVAQTEPQATGEPNVFRILSGTAGNMITFDPPSVHPAVTLEQGKYIEFIAQGGFMAKGTGRIMVAQYMVGENYTPNMSATVGDPSMGQGVPVEQYRTNYDFLTPATYTKSYVNLIAPPTINLMLDNQPVPQSKFTAIGGSGFSFQRISIPPGAHHVSGDAKFGITVSGIASYTSYLYIGGMNLDDVPVQ